MLGNLDLSFFSWSVIGPFVTKGFIFSIWLTVVATIGGIAFGTVLALMRLSGKTALELPAAAYVNTMRSIPLVMVLLWFYLLIPFAIGRPIGAELSAIITFVAFEAAYFSEIVRAGIQSIEKGQWEAATAMGLTRVQTLRKVILPQAIQRVVPPLAGQFISLVKDSSMVSLISIQELTFLGNEVAASTNRMFEVWITISAMYFVICYGLSLAFGRLERRMARGQR